MGEVSGFAMQAKKIITHPDQKYEAYLAAVGVFIRLAAVLCAFVVNELVGHVCHLATVKMVMTDEHSTPPARIHLSRREDGHDLAGVNRLSTLGKGWPWNYFSFLRIRLDLYPNYSE